MPAYDLFQEASCVYDESIEPVLQELFPFLPDDHRQRFSNPFLNKVARVAYVNRTSFKQRAGGTPCIMLPLYKRAMYGAFTGVLLVYPSVSGDIRATTHMHISKGNVNYVMSEPLPGKPYYECTSIREFIFETVVNGPFKGRDRNLVLRGDPKTILIEDTDDTVSFL